MGLNKRLISTAAAAAADDGYFAPVIYTGNGGVKSISSLGFQPNLIWIKSRSGSFNNMLTDFINGNNTHLISNATSALDTNSSAPSFDTNGFTLGGSNNNWNGSGYTYVAWCWKGGGAAVSNTDGTLTTQVSANTINGFSICTYTGSTLASETFGHGLDSAPELVILKQLTSSSNWIVHPTSLGDNNFLYLNTTNSTVSSGNFIRSTNATTVTIGGSSSVSAGSRSYVAYNFHSVTGVQKVGSYTGNGGNQSITTGFAPRFVMVKSSSTTGNWYIFDSSRGDFVRLFPDLSNAESTSTNQISLGLDGFSSGNGGTNTNGVSYIYLAIA